MILIFVSMPSGVEHEQSEVQRFAERLLIFVSMPSGVEHDKLKDPAKRAAL